jgi:hypothetical protein
MLSLSLSLSLSLTLSLLPPFTPYKNGFLTQRITIIGPGSSKVWLEKGVHFRESMENKKIFKNTRKNKRSPILTSFTHYGVSLGRMDDDD